MSVEAARRERFLICLFLIPLAVRYSVSSPLKRLTLCEQNRQLQRLLLFKQVFVHGSVKVVSLG